MPTVPGSTVGYRYYTAQYNKNHLSVYADTRWYLVLP